MQAVTNGLYTEYQLFKIKSSKDHLATTIWLCLTAGYLFLPAICRYLESCSAGPLTSTASPARFQPLHACIILALRLHYPCITLALPLHYHLPTHRVRLDNRPYTPCRIRGYSAHEVEALHPWPPCPMRGVNRRPAATGYIPMKPILPACDKRRSESLQEP